MIYNSVIISALQQNDSVIHIHLSTLFQFLFPYRLSQNIGESSLCYVAGVLLPSVIYTVVCICQTQTPPIYPSPTTVPFGNNMFVCEVWVYFCSVNKFICIIFFFLDFTCKWYHMMFAFLFMTFSLSVIVFRFIHVAANDIALFFMTE